MASKKFLTDLDLQRNEIQNAVIQNLAVDPEVVGSKEGQIYYNTQSHKLMQFNGTAWTQLSSDLTLEHSVSQTGYVYTFRLKDADGNVLSSTEIDLPLEEMIVNVEYDNDNEKFVLTLKDGSTVDIPASGILKGVVTETATQTLTNKTIDADDNTITELEVDNFKTGVVRLSSDTIRPVATAEDDKLATEKAIATRVDERFATFLNPALTPTGGVCSWAIALGHNRDVICSIRETATGEEVYADIIYGSGTITISFNAASDVVAETYTAVVIG